MNIWGYFFKDPHLKNQSRASNALGKLLPKGRANMNKNPRRYIVPYHTKTDKRNQELAGHYLEGQYSIEKTNISKKELVEKDLITTITPSENTFKSHFYRQLQSNIAFYVAHQAFILTYGKSTQKQLLKSSDNAHLVQYLDYITIYRPDFLIPLYGIAIEIDGHIHNKDKVKQTKDSLADYAYAGVDYYVFRISNDDVHSPTKRQKFINAINAYIAECNTDPNLLKKYQARRTRQSTLRKKYKALPQHLKKSSVEKNLTTPIKDSARSKYQAHYCDEHVYWTKIRPVSAIRTK